MTASAASVYEGAAIIYTLTASSPAPTGGTSVDFSVVVGDVAAANQGTSNTNLNDFSSGAFNPTTVVIAAGATTATYTVSSATDTITELPEAYSVKAVTTGTTTKMLRRQIPLAWIESVMAAPEQVTPGFGNRSVYQSRVVAEGKTYLVRLIVEGWQSPPTVVTVYRTSKIEKYWRIP